MASTKIFAAEFVCGGGFRQRNVAAIPKPLRDEGTAMLKALSADLSALGEVIVPLDLRVDVELPPGVRTFPIDASLPLWSQWIAAAQDCDAAIIVAPEHNGALAQAVAMMRAGAVDPVMSSGDFLRIASDKWETARAFASQLVPHPPTFSIATIDSIDPNLANQWIMKPRDGVGSERFVITDDLEAAKAQLQADSVLQPYISGLPASISLIVSGTQMHLLPAVSQVIDPHTGEYLGGSGPLDQDLQRRATALATRAIEAMPPMAKGFIGIDLILGEDARDDCVVEINPRLTTSYVGLRHMVEGNLAEWILGQGTGPIRCKVSAGEVRWTPDGQVWHGSESLEVC